MPWIPVSNQEGYLKTLIKQKAFMPALPTVNKDAKVNEIYKILLNAKNYKQAEAILRAAKSVKNIEELDEYGYDELLNNDETKIKSLMASIPAKLLVIKQQKKAQKDLNDHINGYLLSISKKYKDHQTGAHIVLPVMYDPVQQMAVKYNNGESVLPAAVGGIYIEWYPFIGSTRSIGKRFFTFTNDSRLWYTEGGTHGNLDDWWILETADGDWIKK